MSQGFGCKCAERKKPVKERNWIVLQRECNYSAFSGYRRTDSDYSCVYCKSCRAIGRTRARYVSVLPDGAYSEIT
jgi:hypothetical protein